MFPRNKLISSLLALASILVAPVSIAGNLQAEVNLGLSTLSQSGYNEAGNLDVTFSATSELLSYQLGVMYIGPFSLEENEDDSEINIGAVYLGVSNKFDTGILDLEIGGGLMYSQLQASFQERELDDQNDTSPYVHMKLIKDIGKLVSVQGGYKYIDNLNGSDINLFQAGIRFHF